MRLPALGPRLEAVASLVPQGSRLIDIGCDHARLPIILLAREQISSAVAIDNRRGPLLRAARNARRYRADERLTLVQGDGAVVSLEPDDVVVVSGLGARTLLSIVDTLGDFCGSLILGPQSRLPFLRQGLSERSWRIEEELLVLEDSRLYLVIQARRSREPVLLSALERRLGPRLLERLLNDISDPLLLHYAEKEKRRLLKERPAPEDFAEVLSVLERTEQWTERGRVNATTGS